MHQDAMRPKLPDGQQIAFDMLLNTWMNLSEATVIRIAAPLGRGKTHIVQVFYEYLAENHQISGGFYASKASEYEELASWRKSRKNLSASLPNWEASPDWVWLSVRALPMAVSDLLGDLKETVAGLLEYLTTEGLESAKAVRLKSVLPDQFTGIAGRAAADLLLDQIPFGSTTKTSLRAIIETYSAMRGRGAPLKEFAEFLESDTSYAYIVLMSLLGQLRNPQIGPAILPSIIVIENAEQLEPTALRSLHELLACDPDVLLAERNTLSRSIYRQLKQHGIPPRLPLLLVLMETTNSGDESVLAPNQERTERFKATTSPLRPWLEHCRQTGIPVKEIDSTMLRLMVKDEATDIASKLLPDGLGERHASMIADRATDPFMGGVNAALLISHCAKVSVLSSPEATLTSAWANQHLPLFLSLETEQRFEALSEEERKVIGAAALAGIGFAESTVNSLLPGLDIHRILTQMEKSGYLHSWGEDGLYCFDDNMLHEYAEKTVLSDPHLCRKALDVTEAPKIRDLAEACFAGITYSKAWVYDSLRGSLWRYVEIATGANLGRQWETHRDVWLAALTLTADRDLVFAALEEDADKKQRIDLLFQHRESDPEGDESELLWMILVRWHVHRLTPGPMTPLSLRSAISYGQDLKDNTRTLTSAHRIAARIAGRVLRASILKRGQIGELGIRLVTRLGPYARLMTGEERLLVAQSLLRAGPFSATATHLCCFEYASLLNKAELLALKRQLAWWATMPEPLVRLRSLLALSHIEGNAFGVDLLPQLEDFLMHGEKDDMFRDFDNITGITFGHDPLGYPWWGLRVLLCQEILRLTESSLKERPLLRNAVKEALREEAERHPSAVGLLIENFSSELPEDQIEDLKELAAHWKKTRLLGHSEQAGILPLKRVGKSRSNVTNRSKKKKKRR
ncbi:hypothetical protein [Streptosporangium vulgare]|uniref:ATP-binding protein n=2 Tax=Streptosporangium vulgare TaxID=46190 RepID=A0ABV5TEU6_9ACTN